jgi:hypothetical protein
MRHQWVTDKHVYPRWPGIIVCKKCKARAMAPCDYLDEPGVTRFLKRQNRRDDCK